MQTFYSCCGLWWEETQVNPGSRVGDSWGTEEVAQGGAEPSLWPLYHQGPQPHRDCQVGGKDSYQQGLILAVLRGSPI